MTKEKHANVQQPLAIDAPVTPNLGNWNIKRNLHIWVIGIVGTLLAIFMLLDAMKADRHDEATKAQRQAETEKVVAAQARTELKPSDEVMAKIVSDQNKEAAGLKGQVPASAMLPAGLGGEPAKAPIGLPPGPIGAPLSTVGLPPVPPGPVPTPAAGAAPQLSADAAAEKQKEEEAARKASKREDDITASAILSIDRKGGIGGMLNSASAAPKAPAGMPAIGDLNGDIARRQQDSERRQQETRAQQANLLDRSLSSLPGLGGQTKNTVEADRKWLAAQEGSAAAAPLRPRASPGQYALMQGSVVPAVLVSAIRSDLPGQIKATVSMDVFDSAGHGFLLIPKGSTLVGQYNSEVRIGQEKVLAAFQRLIYPSGVSVDLNGMGAAEAGGESGLMDDVNNHFWKMFATNFMIAGLAQFFQNDQNSGTTTSTNGTTSQSTNTAGQVLVETVKVVNERNKNIPPTIYVYRGHKFNVMVNRDMLLSPYVTGAVQ